MHFLCQSGLLGPLCYKLITIVNIETGCIVLVEGHLRLCA